MGGATRVGFSLGRCFQRGGGSNDLAVRKMLKHAMNANEFHRILL